MTNLALFDGAPDDLGELLKAFEEIQMPRPPFVLEKMVVGGEDTVEQQYAHCVLEMQIAYDNLRVANFTAQLKEIEIAELPDDKKGQLQAQIKKVELEQMNRARLGAIREFTALYSIWKRFPKRYSRAELDGAQATYWDKRLTRQANQELSATGRVGIGSQEALRQIGKGTVPQLDVVRGVEQRFLEQGKSRILITVPTEKQAVQGLPCLKNVSLPTASEIKVFNVHGRPVAEAYNVAALEAVKDSADWLVTVEDDTFPPEDAIIRLLKRARENPGAAVGAWYPKREKPRQGVHIVIRNGERTFLDDDGGLHEVHTLAMGCSIYPCGMFAKIPFPWFATTAILTQDSFFSQLAREHGFKLLCDTSIRCRHIDRKTGEVFA